VHTTTAPAIAIISHRCNFVDSFDHPSVSISAHRLFGRKAPAEQTVRDCSKKKKNRRPANQHDNIISNTMPAAFPPGFFTQPVSNFATPGAYFCINGHNEPVTAFFDASRFVGEEPRSASPAGRRSYRNCLILLSLLDNNNPSFGGTDPRCDGLQLNTITWAANEYALLIGPFEAGEMTGHPGRALSAKLDELQVNRRRLQLIVKLA